MSAQAKTLTPRQVLDKINRAELQSELYIADLQARSSHQKALPSEGWRTACVLNRSLTGDRYLIDDGIPVLRVVQTPPKLRPSKMFTTTACSFGDCQGDPSCSEHCPDKPKASASSQNCAPGGCESKDSCGDRQCHGYPMREATLNSVEKAIRRQNEDLAYMNKVGKYLVLAAIGLIALIAIFFG